MKIGIITQPLHINYGGIIQNYALQKVLGKFGYKSITLDTTAVKFSYKMYIITFVKTFLKRILGENKPYPYRASEKENLIIQQNIKYFISKHINSTKKIEKDNDFSTIIEENKIEALITGSDQVWRPSYNNNILNSFFNFARHKNIIKISYAASFGVDYWEYTPKDTKIVQELIKDFKAISVREESGIDLCKRYLKCDAIQVLDPTMLLNKEDYIKVIVEDNESKIEGDIFAYILDDTNEKKQIVDTASRQLNLKTFSIMPSMVNAQSIKDITKCIYPSPSKWLRSFLDAQYIICDSFHGAVFSIIFNKPFIVIGNKKRGLTRFTSLLKLFSLEDRIITSKDDINILTKFIDWDSVNKKREELKIKSLSFLTNNLN